MAYPLQRPTHHHGLSQALNPFLKLLTISKCICVNPRDPKYSEESRIGHVNRNPNMGKPQGFWEEFWTLGPQGSLWKEPYVGMKGFDPHPLKKAFKEDRKSLKLALKKGWEPLKKVFKKG